MGTTLRSNVDASAYATKAITDVPDGLRTMRFFDSNMRKVANDFAIGSAVTTSVVGTPDVSDEGTTFTSDAHYLKTDLPDTGALSFAVVMRALHSYAEMGEDPAKRCFAAGNSFNGNGVLLGFAIQGDGSIGFGRYMSTQTGTTLKAAYLGPNVGAGDATAWRLVRGRVNPDYTVSVRDETNAWAFTTSLDAAVTGYAVSNMPLQIGDSYGTAQRGPTGLSQLRIYDRALSEAEFAVIVAEMRRYELLHNNRTV